MSFFVVLVSDPAARALAPSLAENVRADVQGAAPRWLMADVACEIAFSGPSAEPKTLADRLRGVVAGAPVDVAVLPAEGRRKRLLVADMDSTIIGQECVDELAGLVGLRSRVAAITERAMRGEIDFEPALRERVALLKGIGLETVTRLIDERITLNPGARTLVGTMRANGAYAALVSGGFSIFTSAIAALAGFDEDRSNELLLDGDRIAGAVREPILGRDAKKSALQELTAKHALPVDASIAVGDGANDLAMLDAAGLGVAYHAKPAVAAAADVRIDHGDLTALLFLQGYTQAEFHD